MPEKEKVTPEEWDLLTEQALQISPDQFSQRLSEQLDGARTRVGARIRNTFKAYHAAIVRNVIAGVEPPRRKTLLREQLIQRIEKKQSELKKLIDSLEEMDAKEGLTAPIRAPSGR